MSSARNGHIFIDTRTVTQTKFAHAPPQIVFLPRDTKADTKHAVLRATELVAAGVVAIVGSAKSGTAAAVQNFLQRSTTVAQIGEWQGVWCS